MIVSLFTIRRKKPAVLPVVPYLAMRIE